VAKGTRSEAAGKIIRKEYGYKPSATPKMPNFQKEEQEESEDEEVEQFDEDGGGEPKDGTFID
jgi:phage terminase small subunit